MARRLNVTLIALVVFISMTVPIALSAHSATASLYGNQVYFTESSDGGIIIGESDVQDRIVTGFEIFDRPAFRVESGEDPDGNVSGRPVHNDSFELTIPANTSFCIYVERANNNSVALNFDLIFLPKHSESTVYNTNDFKTNSFYTVKSLNGTLMIPLSSIDDVEFMNSGEEGVELNISLSRKGQHPLKLYIIYE